MSMMPQIFRFALPLVASLGLAACAMGPEPDVMAEQDIVTPVSGIAGLQTREPTLFCDTDKYRAYVGQPGNMIASLGISGPYRVVEHRGLSPQDYDPQRTLFRLDATGNIASVDCG